VNRRSNAWGRLSYTGHVALFSSCSPLIFFHADKTTELAAAIIPVMILHGLHTDSTYHSPLRETFVKDIREDFSNLVHCNLAWIYPIVWYQTKTKCRFPDFQDNVNLITWLLGFGNVCIHGIGRKKKPLKSALNNHLWHRIVSQENETRNCKKTLHWSFSLLASGDK